MKFRTDINGLRAYAVLAVMIFHFNKQWLPGGFAGVDVFFVISGYLMTSIIFKSLNTNNFVLLKFYASRIKRIIPALLILVIILVALGYFFLGPGSYRSLTKESIRSLFFISNFLYWRDSGYFAEGALSRPLLHTWSLSVEWQFYILYPVVLMLCAKFFNFSALKKGILFIAALSLGISIYFTYKDPIASYFLLPTRIWEMLLGGIVFLYPLNLSKNWQKYSLEHIGLILIIISFFIINENTPWPGYMALIPTLGTVILLQANGSSYLTNNVVFQKVGLWSYSLYLYHWPIVFINHRYNLHMSFWVFLTLSFVLAILSYYFIEQRKWKVKHILIAVFIALIPIYGVYKTNGASFRVIDKYVLSSAEFQMLYYGGGDFPVNEMAFTAPHENNDDYDYELIGDSFLRQYAKYLTKNEIRTRTWFGNGCLFMPEYINLLYNVESKECTEIVEKFDIANQAHSQKPLVWTQNWVYNIINAKDKSFNTLSIDTNPKYYYETLMTGLKNMIERNSGRNIYLIGAYTRPSYNIYECLSSRSLSIFSTQSCAEFTPQTSFEINEHLQNTIADYPNVYLIDPNKGFCDEDGCRMIINNEPMFSDDGHFSIYGADIVGKYLFDEIKRIESNTLPNQ